MDENQIEEYSSKLRNHVPACLVSAAAYFGLCYNEEAEDMPGVIEDLTKQIGFYQTSFENAFDKPLRLDEQAKKLLIVYGLFGGHYDLEPLFQDLVGRHIEKRSLIDNSAHAEIVVNHLDLDNPSGLIDRIQNGNQEYTLNI